MAMEVDDTEDESRKQGCVQRVLKLIAENQVWYENTVEANRLANEVLHAVSWSPGHVYQITGHLVNALCVGAKDAAASRVSLCGKSWASRAELNAECKAMLRRYPENGSHVDGEDAQLLLELLVYHPSGAQKTRRCVGLCVGVHPVFGKRCFMVVRKSSGKHEDFSYARCVDNLPTQEVECQRRICDVIRGITQLHPTACESICSVIEDKFIDPKSFRYTVEHHRNWVRSLLHLCTEVSTFTSWTLSLLVRKMLDLDTKILKAEEMKEEDDDAVAEVATGAPKVDRLAEILDAQMMSLFEYLQRNLGGPNGAVDSMMVPMMFGIFDTIVIPTERCKYVQFLFFYFASLQVGWAEQYLNNLLNHINKPDNTFQKRLLGFSYISSFVARAAFLTPLFGIKVCHHLTEFLMHMQEAAERHFMEGRSDHPMIRLFFAGVQSVCYILCFNFSRFSEDPASQGELKALLPAWGTPRSSSENFTPILESTLQPITHIHPNVAQQFCRAIRHDFPGIASRCKKCMREAPRHPQAHPETGLGGKDDLELYYPFDPYRLFGSHIFLTAIYRPWKDDTNDQGESTEDDEHGFDTEEDVVEQRKRERAASTANSFGEGDSDVDFTDMTEPIERGFIPSVGPSPALRPQHYPTLAEEMSPFLGPMDAMEEDNFALPEPSLDNRGANSILDQFLGNKAFAG